MRYSIGLFAILFWIGYAGGTTYTVDDDGPAQFSKIQDAINTAADGDTVQVATGHYYENIDFRGKAIIVTSTNPTDPNIVTATVIDANGDGIVVSFHSNEGPESILTGFTITGGHAKYGAGICIWGDANPFISKCLIFENHAEDIYESKGAGIYTKNGIIQDCIISNNSTGFWAGGIYCDYNSDSIIIRCNIIDNYAMEAGGGIYIQSSGHTNIIDCVIQNNSTQFKAGGIYFNNDCDSIVDNCIISNNSSDRGGGVTCQVSNVSFQRCKFINNYVSDWGGAIHFYFFSNGFVDNCLFVGNIAENDAGAIMCEYSSSPLMQNSTFFSNSCVTGFGSTIYCGENCSASIINNIITDSSSGVAVYAIYSSPVIDYNNVWDNIDGGYGGWAWPGEHDISVDPCFVQPGYWDDNGTPDDTGDDLWVDGDYHLRPDSLCINAGDPAFVPEPEETDMDGETRVRLGRVDIGADEAGSYPADFDENGRIDLTDFAIIAAAWGSTTSDANFDVRCNIAQPQNEMIDMLDLCVYCGQWLWRTPWAN